MTDRSQRRPKGTAPRYEYEKKWREEHPEYTKQKNLEWRTNHPNYLRENLTSHQQAVKKWMDEHPEEHREAHLKASVNFIKRNPKKLRAERFAFNFPLALQCELCPEDDKRTENLERHHFDYDYADFFVTVCYECHLYAEGKRKIEYSMPECMKS